MNLQELINKLEAIGLIKSSRLANIKMSARRYAEALGCISSDECPEAVFVIDKLPRGQIIEKCLGNGKSHHTVRNTKNDISFLLRLGEKLNFIKPISSKSPSLDEKSFGRRKINHKLPSIVPYEETSFDKGAYSLPLAKWDKLLRDQYDEWLEWVTTPNNKIGDSDPYNRPATIETKTDKMAAFFGFLKNVKGISELDFEMMIDVAVETPNEIEREEFVRYREQRDAGLLEEFVSWHMRRYKGKLTAQARAVINVALSLTEKFYFLKALKLKNSSSTKKYKQITNEIKEFRGVLETKQPLKPIIPKVARVISKTDLRKAAIQEFPDDRNLKNSKSGIIKASDAGRALAIMLMLDFPFRSKNLREAKLGRNIFRNPDGKWVVRFAENDDLNQQKYKKRRNNFEAFDHEISFETTKYLETYLNHWHPKLTDRLNRQIQGAHEENSNLRIHPQETYLFLTSSGLPFSRQTFSKWVERGIFRWFGVRVNPDLIRQIASAK